MVKTRTMILDGADYPVYRLETDGLESRVNCRVYPLLLMAGLAASAAGTGLSMAGSAKSADAMANARNVFLNQQKQLQEQGNTVFQTSLKKAGPDASAAALKSGADSRNALVAALKNSAAPMPTALPATDASSYSVSDPSARLGNVAQTAGNASRAQAQGATSRLGAYEDLNTQQALDNAEATRNMAPISSKSRGNAAVFPTELEAASHAGDGLSQWGQIVSALGSVASMGAASGFGAGSAASTAANAAKTAATTGGWSGNLFGSLASGAVPATTSFVPATTNAWAAALAGLPPAMRDTHRQIFGD